MSMFDFFKRSKNKPKQYRIKRQFDGAKGGRLFSQWTTTNKSAASELRDQLRVLRARSRELCQNNDYAKRFLRLQTTNIVGPSGIHFEPKVTEDNGTPDIRANEILRKSFMEWGKKGNCTVDGQLSWVDAQRLFVETVCRDGEVLVRLVRKYDNPHKFALHFIECDHLNEQHNEETRNGFEIKMGIECNHYGKPVAYHIAKRNPADTFVSRSESNERVPAENMIHGYVAERANQLRGIPWATTAMTRLHMLGAYEESELVACRVASAKMGFITSPDGEGYTGEDVEDYNPIMSAEPGTFEQLPAGMAVQTFDPDHPTTAFRDFEKAMLRGISSGLNVSYASLSNDLESVNYSSIRQGSLDERDQYRVMQRWLTDHFLQPVFDAWLEEQLTHELLSSLPMRKIEKFNQAEWRPRGWQWIDPTKEVAANIEAVKNGFKSLADVAGETGRDSEDVLNKLSNEKLQADALGLELQLGKARDSVVPTEEPEND